MCAGKVVCRLAAAFFCAVAVAATAFAAELVRGPYIQTTSPDGATIRWRTESPAPSILAYGASVEAQTQQVVDLVPKTEHILRVTGLSADAKYFYTISNATGVLASGVDYFFHTHPVPGTPKPTRVWIIGDPGTDGTGADEHQREVRDAYYGYTRGRRTDVFLALGDNAYFNGTDAEYQARFFDIYRDLMRSTPVWPTMGNHETYGGPGPTWAYDQVFTFPLNAEAGGVASGTTRYYSFDHGNIHFVSLDSQEASRAEDGPMATWLKADLGANTNLWLVAYFHHPPYTKGSHDSDSELQHIEMRQNILPILEAHGVDLVFGGHSHIYERSKFVTAHYGDSTALSPTNILNAGSGRPGEGGAYLKATHGPRGGQGTVYVVAGSSGWATYRTGYHPVMFMDELETGSVVLDFSTNRVEAIFLRENGLIDDSFTILKTEPATVTIRRSESGHIVRWNAVSGRKYRVQRTLGLELPDWQDASGVLAAESEAMSWTNAVPGDAVHALYRVVEISE